MAKTTGNFANGNKIAEDTTITELSSATAQDIWPPGPPRRVMMVMGMGGPGATIVLRRASNQEEVARFDVPAEHSSALLELTGVTGGLEAILDQPADDVLVRVWSEDE